MMEVIGQPGVAERLSKEAVLLNEQLEINKIMDQWIAWIREMMEKWEKITDEDSFKKNVPSFERPGVYFFTIPDGVGVLAGFEGTEEF